MSVAVELSADEDVVVVVTDDYDSFQEWMNEMCPYHLLISLSRYWYLRPSDWDGPEKVSARVTYKLEPNDLMAFKLAWL